MTMNRQPTGGEPRPGNSNHAEIPTRSEAPPAGPADGVRLSGKIVHPTPGIGASRPAASAGPNLGQFAPGTPAPPKPIDESMKPVPVAESTGPAVAPKITPFEKSRRHEDLWRRTPNTTGSGAIHVKTFHCKITDDALTYLDQSINEWLDAHPQYEVKFVSTTIGIMTGKLKEPALICQVWV